MVQQLIQLALSYFAAIKRGDDPTTTFNSLIAHLRHFTGSGLANERPEISTELLVLMIPFTTGLLAAMDPETTIAELRRLAGAPEEEQMSEKQKGKCRED